MTIQECVVESIQRAVPELEASVIGEMLEIPPDTSDMIILSFTNNAPTWRRLQYEFSAQIAAIRR